MKNEEIQTMQKILDFCDAADISIRHWTERVKSVHPTNTRKIETNALFMSVAPGISIMQLDGRLVGSDPAKLATRWPTSITSLSLKRQ